MDLNMPVMSGLKASQKILDTKINVPKPKIVAITGFANDEEKLK